jgi:adenosine/AMP kinase
MGRPAAVRGGSMDVKVTAVPLSFEEGTNIIVGQSHFIKTVEDLAEILHSTVPGVKYGLAFCEASGPCLIRTEGNDGKLVSEAAACARAVAAGHSFFLILKDAYPINVLTQIKACQEVCRIFCATANPVQVLVGTTAQGNGILGVVDGSPPKGVEGEADRADRKAMLRKFGYKF